MTDTYMPFYVVSHNISKVKKFHKPLIERSLDMHREKLFLSKKIPWKILKINPMHFQETTIFNEGGKYTQ